MDSWLKKSHDNDNNRTADDVEAMERQMQTGCANVLACCAHWVTMPCGDFFPLNNYHKYTIQTVYYFNRNGARKFLEKEKGVASKKVWEALF